MTGVQFAKTAMDQQGMTPGEIQEMFEEKMAEIKRAEAEQDANEQHHQEQQALNERLLEEKAMEAEAAANRPQEDALNQSIGGLPMQMASTAIVLGLGMEAVEAAGGMMSPGDLGDQMMVTTNSNGDMLADARAGLDVNSPAADTIVNGPGQTASFQPGITPEPTAAPQVAQAAPGADMQNIPGMDGPSMGGPGGMGA